MRRHRAIRADGQTCPPAPSSPVARNAPTLHDRVTALAGDTRTQVTAVQSAFADSGMGVGSEYVQSLKKPKILLAAGDGVSTTTFGDVWFYLEKELQYPLVPVDLGNLGRVNLADYNLLILPDGSGSTMLRRAGNAERIKQWVQEAERSYRSGRQWIVTAKERALSTVGRWVHGRTAQGTTKNPGDTTWRYGPTGSAPCLRRSGRPKTEYSRGLSPRALDRPTGSRTACETSSGLPERQHLLHPSKKGQSVVFVGRNDHSA